MELLRVLTPAGILLLSIGIGELVRKKRDRSSAAGSLLSSRLAGPLLGTVCFFVFLLCTRTRGPTRYLSPLLPAAFLLECVGLGWVARPRA